MPKFSVRAPEGLASRFDAAAALAGGRSARLRQLIASAAEGPTAAAWPAPGPSVSRLMVRLLALEAEHVPRQAGAMKLRTSGWVAALVRRHALGRPILPRDQEPAVLAVQAEVHRIRTNVNQIARALNTAVLEGGVLDLELSELAALQRELRAHLVALRGAFEGNLADWDVES